MSTDGHTFDLQRLFWTQTTDHHVNISLFNIQVCLQISAQLMKLCEHNVIFSENSNIQYFVNLFCKQGTQFFGGGGTALKAKPSNEYKTSG